MEKLKVVITLAERVRSKGRDKGLERWGLWNSLERGEENYYYYYYFFLISGEEKLVYKDLFGFS